MLHQLTSNKPLPSCKRSGHSFPPLRAGLNIILYLNLVPVASGALQLVQSETIHGSCTVNKKEQLESRKPLW